MHAHVALPELAHGVPILAVPFHPSQWEITDLIATLTQVPGFGDELGGRQGRVLINGVEKSAEFVDVLKFTRQRGGQVKPKAVDVHFGDPVAKAVHQQLDGMRVHHVQRVAATGEVHVVARITRDHPVVGQIIDTAERKRRPGLIAFGRMVVNHVQDDLKAGVVECLDHLLELANHFRRSLRVARIPRLRSEESQRVVAPIVPQSPVDEMSVLDEGMHRHQFERGNTQFFQVFDDRLGRHPRIGAAQVLRDLRMHFAHSANMRFVDQGFVRRIRGTIFAAPIETRIDHRPQWRKGTAVPIIKCQIRVRFSELVAE